MAALFKTRKPVSAEGISIPRRGILIRVAIVIALSCLPRKPDLADAKARLNCCEEAEDCYSEPSNGSMYSLNVTTETLISFVGG
jgi:hypothetical protein